MSVPTEMTTSSDLTEATDWQPTPPPTDLIFDDGEPLESNRHRTAMNVLIRAIEHAWSDRQDFFVGGNMFIYYSATQVRNKDFRGPDFFVVLDTQRNFDRQGWVVWEEAGRYPDVIVELLSDSTAAIDRGPKKALYERTFKTRDYFIFDPFDPNSLQGWRLDTDQHYQPLSPNDQGWLWSETLGYWVGTWSGTIEGQTAPWLRFYDQTGNLVLLPEEAERQRADAATQQAEMAQQQAEAERQRAEVAQQQAEAERQRAETEHQRAEAAQQQAEAERQRAELLAERLRALGVDLEQP